MRFERKGDDNIAIITDERMDNLQGALDLLGNVFFNGCDAMIIGRENISDDFFDLSTKLAGDILQKFSNYNMRIAIIGDFSNVESSSLRDFIYECNKGNRVFFKASVAKGLEAICK